MPRAREWAASLAVDSFLFAAAMGVGLFFFGANYYWLATASSILVFLGCSLWIIVSACRIGAKAGWGVFFAAAGATLVCMGVAYHLLESEDFELERQRRQQKSAAIIEFLRPAEDARHRVAGRAPDSEPFRPSASRISVLAGAASGGLAFCTMPELWRQMPARPVQ